MDHLFIRADASTEIGAGHLMRCLALAQAWKARGGRATFITACESAGLYRRLVDEGFGVVRVDRSYPDPADWRVSGDHLAHYSGAWVVLDGYHFDAAYQCRIREAGHRLLVIDDMAHLDYYCADILLNQNIYAAELTYSCRPETKMLLGVSHALLRREFMAWQSRRGEIPETALRVLVTLGGSDPDNVTLKVVKALHLLGSTGWNWEARIVAGAANPHLGALRREIGLLEDRIRLLADVNNMPELMAWADVAVSGAGSTCWELAFMGLPALLLVLAENQRRVAAAVAAGGAGIDLGAYETISEADMARALEDLMQNAGERRRLSERGRQWVDGRGASRVIAALREVMS